MQLLPKDCVKMDTRSLFISMALRIFLMKI